MINGLLRLNFSRFLKTMSSIRLNDLFTKKEKWIMLFICILCALLFLAMTLDSILYYTSPLYSYKLKKLNQINYTLPLNYSRHVIHF